MSCLKIFAVVSSLLFTRIREASLTAETIRASYFFLLRDLCLHSPEPTDLGLQNEFPRGAVWLQNGEQHRGHDIWCQAGQEKGIEQNKALYSVFIDFTKAFDTVNREGPWTVLERYG